MYIPEDLRLVNARRNTSAVIERTNITLYPTGSNETTSNINTSSGPWLEFKLPSLPNKTYDMSSFFIHWTFRINVGSLTKTAANHVRLHVYDSIESIIRTVEVYIGGSNVPAERIENYCSLETMLNCHVSDNFMKTYGSRAMYAGLSSNQRNQIYVNQSTNATFTSNSVQCSFPLRGCGVSNPNLNLPASVFGSVFCTVRIELQSPANCIYARQEGVVTFTAASGVLGGGDPTQITGDTTSLTYTLSNIRCTVDTITYSNEYAQMLNQALATSKLTFPIKTWDNQVRTIPSSVSRFSENLSFNYSSIEALFFTFNRQDEVNVFSKAGLDRMWFPAGLSSIQLTINGRKFPSQPIDLSNNASEAYVHLVSALNQLDSMEVVGSQSYFTNPQTVVPFIVSGSLYYSSNLPLQTLGDVYYGRNRPVTSATTHVLSTSADYNNGQYIYGGTASVPSHTTTSGLILPYINEQSPSCFTIGINLRKLMTSELGIVSGEDLRNSAGVVSYDLVFSTSTVNAWNMNVFCLHNRFLNVDGSMVSVDT